MRTVSLYRYPVKGLSPEPLDHARLEAGETIKGDRAIAIENGPSGFDIDAPQHMPKIKFLTLMRNPSLAALRTRFDDATRVLTISSPDGRDIAGSIDDGNGQAGLLDFLTDYVGDQVRGRLRLLQSPGHSFSDVALKCLHVVNLATVRDLESRFAIPIDPLRFRPNIIIDGLEPWREFDLIGKRISTASGAELELVDRTERCAATRANPVTGIADCDVPQLLDQQVGHTDVGVYALVTRSGPISPGARLSEVTPEPRSEGAMPF